MTLDAEPADVVPAAAARCEAGHGQLLSPQAQRERHGAHQRRDGRWLLLGRCFGGVVVGARRRECGIASSASWRTSRGPAMRCFNAHDRTLANAVATRTTRLRGAS
jgi:hypothetical protein